LGPILQAGILRIDNPLVTFVEPDILLRTRTMDFYDGGFFTPFSGKQRSSKSQTQGE